MNWKREANAALAEVDYLFDKQGVVVPIEVKSGQGSMLRSMHQFLLDHSKFQIGVRFWSQNYSKMDKIDPRPLYAVSTLAHSDQKQALQSLITCTRFE